MTDPGEDPTEKRKSGRPEWLPSGYAWDLVLVLLGFMLGVMIMLWLALRFGW